MTRESSATILVVDDSTTTLEVAQRHLVAAGFEVHTATSVAEAIKRLDAVSIDLVVTDFKMPEVTGLELVRHIRENLPTTEVVMITGYASIEGAIEAVKTGAEEYLSKPFTEEELLAAVHKALDKRNLLNHRVSDTPAAHGLVGSSQAIRAVHTIIEKAAATDATVLICGESGTGKELVARAVHYASDRARATFVPVNCGGIPEGLLESEMFGHVRGAFTGASETRAGFFQTADGGTIFLDEISEMSVAMQVKLLRVLQDHHVNMVGGNRPRLVDVRIIAATNRHLEKLVKRGVFREDLFFRLNVITIDVPPLRDRQDDVLILVRYFATKYAERHAKDTTEFSTAALHALNGYHWPGNVRELENLVHRLVVMADGPTVDVSDLPAHMRFSAARGNPTQHTLAQVEVEHIRLVLANVNGNKTRAAQLLGIDRKTLRDKINRYGID